MTTARQYLAWCSRQVGTQEKPRGSNRQPYAALAGHANGQPWCATGLVAGAKVTDLRLPPGATSAYTPALEQAFRNAGRLSTVPHVGDWGFVYFPAMKPQPRVAHTFVVWKVTPGYVHTVEFNSNDDGSREGYEVCLRKRVTLRSPGAVGVRSYGQPYYDQEDDMPTAKEIADAVLGQDSIPNKSAAAAGKKGKDATTSLRWMLSDMEETQDQHGQLLAAHGKALARIEKVLAGLAAAK